MESNIILNIVLLSISTVFVIDETGIVEYFKKKLARFLTKFNTKAIYKYKATDIDLRPFECSLCMTFWLGNLMLLINNQYSLLNFTIVCLASYSTRTVKDVLDLLQNLADYFINYIYKKLR